jgi:3-oxoacyl-[acyl-carrier protein] reductase
MDLGLQNKKVLVTGASRGLGAATAALFSVEGAVVTINSRKADALAATASKISSASGNSVWTVAGDLAEGDTARQVAATAADKMGGLDILICNAGGPPPGRFDELDDLAWQRATDTLLMSAVRLIRASLPFLRQSSSASILTITSYSIKQPLPNLILSNSVRGAVAGLTKSLALELGAERIRVNSILPAWTETERVTELMTDRARRAGTSVEIEIQKQSAGSPLGRMATPEEFARVAVFLCSQAASYLTGVMLPVDGGMYKGTF